MRRALLPAAAFAAMLCLPGAAHAKWDPVTTPGASNTDEVSLLRTPDNRLHVAWRRQPDATSYELNHTVIAPDGAVGAAQVIASGWAGIGSPALMRTAAGQLELVAAAQHSIDAGDPIQNVAHFTSFDGGGSWVLTPSDVATGAGFADPMSALAGTDGATPFFAWATSSGLFVHRGTDAAVPAANLQGASCCAYEPTLAVDASAGRLGVAWYSNATGQNGVWAQAVDPATGAPAGPAARMPGTAASVPPDQRIAFTGRGAQPGLFAAYSGGGPAASKVLVWTVGGGTATLARSASAVREPALTVTPEGRLWVTWAAGKHVYARRSNLTATKWGATTQVAVRAGTGTVYKLAADAQSQVLDVLAGFEPTGANGVQTWHDQLRPGLTLEVSAGPIHNHFRTVKLRVTDAGDPVAGAHVTVGGQHATTGTSGRATITVPAGHSLAATATKAGYVRATS
ncbi:FAM171 family protein [Solirubrobacter ginsenosidimutans]|uniref:FAM171 family protein n=1 Tax=Solirubrobacter ginsenosidimutans TaxID=490573 RepID=A0A9X3MMC4_9ACTN|nr:hypothetical protein [Solirubrobacter ginsenosidimutans]MDA0159079.1 FAM171 family protein [Solirubrobacter ginsenosidimutans]